MANPYLDYATFTALADVRDVLDLSGDSNNSNGDENAIQTILDMAAAELDSYLDGRYALPVVNPPSGYPNPLAFCGKIVAALAKKSLFGRRSDMPEEVKAEIDWADDWLKKLVTGVVGLPGITRQTEPQLWYSGSLKGKSRFDHVGGICPNKNELGRATGV